MLKDHLSVNSTVVVNWDEQGRAVVRGSKTEGACSVDGMVVPLWGSLWVLSFGVHDDEAFHGATHLRAGACVLLVESLGHRYINIRGSGSLDAPPVPAGSDSTFLLLYPGAPKAYFSKKEQS